MQFGRNIQYSSDHPIGKTYISKYIKEAYERAGMKEPGGPDGGYGGTDDDLDQHDEL